MVIYVLVHLYHWVTNRQVLWSALAIKSMDSRLATESHWRLAFHVGSAQYVEEVGITCARR